ncbi:MAG: phospholipase C, phosphocholine-specific [Phyllobacterium sp.]|uniref:phosphocholine-specific phospholipase C n=1 Tax=Phyllobacterium sp. TaxID=1871046 RepID=UPI0030F0E3B3
MDRRDFIKMLGLAGTSAAAYTACSAYMQEALAQSSTTIDELLTASAGCKGSLADVQHVVFLMQENRAFDHYFGTLRGVRGFGDPRPQKLRNGKNVWEQSQGAKPYRVPKNVKYEASISGETTDPENVGRIYLSDPAHDFADGIGAWNGGLMDQWIENKGRLAMAHYTETDIPLYFQLARAFTVCDAYFCAHNGGTDANRSIFYTGTCKGKTSNSYFSMGGKPESRNWKSYPEKLEDLGVSWKFYQDGLTWTSDPFAGNYGDNTLEYFQQYQDKTTSIYKKNQSVNSILRTSVDQPSQFEMDIRDDKLPAVSWICAPEAFTEHPHFPPYFGEYYLLEILRAFTVNKDVWKKTLFIITYDENGGFFDHVLPPVPPIEAARGKVSSGIKLDPEAGNIHSEVSWAKKEPIGMGIRVPTLVISPWSTGGRVNSEVFDHTSALQFLEKWLVARGIQSPDTPIFPQISHWRQTIAGDLTSTLDFTQAEAAVLDTLVKPHPPMKILAKADKDKVPSGFWALFGGATYSPTEQEMKATANFDKPTVLKQDQTRCHLMPVKYDFKVVASIDATGIKYSVTNAGPLGVALTVIPYGSTDKPKLYSIEGAKSGVPLELADTAVLAGTGEYSYAVHGPNGYLFEFRGNAKDGPQQMIAEITDIKSKSDGKLIEFSFGKWNPNGKLTMMNAYTKDTKSLGDGTTVLETATVDGWYDVAFFNDGTYLRRFAGHLENGKMSRSDPAIGQQYDEKERVYKPLTV